MHRVSERLVCNCVAKPRPRPVTRARTCLPEGRALAQLAAMAVPRWAQGAMVDGLLADLIVIVHLGFIAFIGVRGFLAWRWPHRHCQLRLSADAVGKHLRYVAMKAGYAGGWSTMSSPEFSILTG